MLPGSAARGGVSLFPDAERLFERYPWPGNIRELRNVLERALLFGEGAALSARDFHFEQGSGAAAAAGDDIDLTLKEVEIRHIRRVLEAEGGHVERAAARMEIPKSSLYEKIRRYGIAVSRI